jgi:hypothetical protein
MENKWNSGVRAGELGLSVRSWSAKLLLTTILFLFPLCFLLSACLPVSTSGYYVSTTGNDANPGTINQPWKTIQKAANTMIAGDTVNVLAGSYSERISVTRSGTSGSPITFRPQGTVVIKGFVVRADYITINGFEVANTDKQNAGIFIKGAYNIIENNYVHHAAARGIEFYAYPIDNTILLTHDNIVRNNRLYYNGSVGIFVNGRNNIIENNEIWGNQQCLPINGYCSDADGIYFFGQGHVFRGNYIHDISFGPPGINPAIGDYNDNPHIDCFQTWASNPDYSEQASNILFEGNYCDNLQYQNDYEKGEGWMFEGGAHDITIRNNIIRAYRGINTYGGDGTWADHLYIYNNTFINNLAFPAQPNVAELKNPVGSIIKNNIFYDQKNGIVDLYGDTTGLIIDYNLVYNTDGSLPKNLPYPILHELRKVNPQFVNPSAKDYHLQSGSPAINSGTNVDLVNDYDGNPRPQGTGFDMGAFEYSGDTTLTPTKSITFTPTGITTIQADLYKDGKVDIFDYNILVSNYIFHACFFSRIC